MVSKLFRGIFNTAVIGIMSLLVSSAFTMTAFAASPGDVGTWADTTPIPQSLSETSSVTYNGHAFVIGGNNGISDVDTVYSAPLNPNGTVGTWVTTTPLPQNLSNSTSVVYNGYVYVIGGYLDTVYSAPLNLDGTIGAWTTSVTTLPKTIGQATSITYNGYIYVMGGYDINTGTTQDTVYSASISDGVVDTWAASPNSLPQELRFASAITYNDYAYVIGGESNSGNSDIVYSALLGSNGTVGAWTASDHTLPKELSDHNAVSYNGYVYVMGGVGNSGGSNAVYSAPLGASGDIGTWVTSSNTLPQAMRYASAITYNGYVYNIGGNGSTGNINNVYYAQLTGYLPPSTLTRTVTVVSMPEPTITTLPQTGADL